MATTAPAGRRARVLAGAGLVGAIGTFMAGLATLGAWGPPGSVAYEAYEVANRLAAVTLLGMAGAPLALRTVLAERDATGRDAMAVATGAVLVMAAGAAAEFWLFSDAPYRGAGSEGRLAAYLAFIIAGLVFLLAAVRAAVALRPPLVSRLVGIATLAAIAAAVAIALTGGSLYLGAPLAAVALAVCALRVQID